jgi:hypothetical protein
MKVLKLGIIIILMGFIAIQFIRPEKNTGTGESDKDIAQVLSVPSSVHQRIKPKKIIFSF